MYIYENVTEKAIHFLEFLCVKFKKKNYIRYHRYCNFKRIKKKLLKLLCIYISFGVTNSSHNIEIQTTAKDYSGNSLIQIKIPSSFFSHLI